MGVPVIACTCEVCTSLDFRDKRLRTSIMVRDEHTCIVIDTGPDFRQQALTNRINHLDAVLFTHEHKDHTAGLDDVRAYNYFQEEDMPVYASNNVIDVLKREYEYCFAEHKYPGVPLLDIHSINLEPFHIGTLQITPIQVLHLHLPVLGFRFGDFTYITDANFISPDEIEKIKGSKIVVLNALRKEKHISHFNLEEAIALAQELGAEKTYFTHLSHQMGLHREIEKALPQGIHLAYDTLQLTLS
jgi:phosphoribosyl 1,2-cyclic phosphate phosphodiesterase